MGYVELAAASLDITDAIQKKVKVVRIGDCYDAINERFVTGFGIELPEDPGRDNVPEGNLIPMKNSEALEEVA